MCQPQSMPYFTEQLFEPLGIPNISNPKGFVGRSYPLLDSHAIFPQALPAGKGLAPLAFHCSSGGALLTDTYDATGRCAASGYVATAYDPRNPEVFLPPCVVGPKSHPIVDKAAHSAAQSTASCNPPQRPVAGINAPFRLETLGGQANQASAQHSVMQAEGSSPEASNPVQGELEPRVTRTREKKHACWMCHKSFDRPSTLRKHLLVHTGEKAFVCNTCGRRFGVASNLNRHIRRCILRPVHSGTSPPVQQLGAIAERPNTTVASLADAPGVVPPSYDLHTTRQSHPGTPAAAFQSSKRSRGTSSLSLQRSECPPGASDAQSSAEPRSKPVTKRRRRAPSPSRWVPQSLRAFNLCPVEGTKATPVPLPPVVPMKCGAFEEERNSWDVFGLRPYHPDGWVGKLPGPGLGMARGGGGFMGKLIMS